MEREEQECECLSDFAVREGFSRQYASKLSKSGKLSTDGGHFHFVEKMREYQKQYVEGISLLTDKQQTTNNNKHVNQGNVGSYETSVVSLDSDIVSEFETLLNVQIEVEEPPIPPPKSNFGLRAKDLIALWD